MTIEIVSLEEVGLEVNSFGFVQALEPEREIENDLWGIDWWEDFLREQAIPIL